MPHQIISMVVVAAVLACPLGCSLGSVFAASCCAMVLETPDTTSEPATSDCCHCCQQPDSTVADNNRDCPEERPEESSCQGVCGGAILGKPCELDNIGDVMNPPLTDAGQSAAASRIAHHHSVPVGEDIDPGGCNYGRSLRALHSSFLC